MENCYMRIHDTADNRCVCVCVCVCVCCHIYSLYPALPISYQIIGDNCDLHQHASRLTLLSRDSQLHWFQMYGIQNRVSGAHLSDKEPQANVEELPIRTWLPSVNDCLQLCDDFMFLAGRILLRRLQEFQWLRCAVLPEISHKYSAQMASRSQIVS